MKVTIADAQERVSALLAQSAVNFSEQDRRYICPEGFQPKLVLMQNGRKKRSDASFDSWSPETGTISISFVKTDEQPTSLEIPDDQPSSAVPADAEDALCRELEALEKQNHDFIALKWFRDTVLPRTSHSWAQDTNERRRLLEQAIQSGKVMVAKINNPRSPAFPTTTIRLNRSSAPADIAGTPRYRPVRISGESLSSTLLRDRGNR